MLRRSRGPQDSCLIPPHLCLRNKAFGTNCSPRITLVNTHTPSLPLCPLPPERVSEARGDQVRAANHVAGVSVEPQW